VDVCVVVLCEFGVYLLWELDGVICYVGMVGE